MQAWKRPDGQYTLIFGEPGNGFRKRRHLRKLGASFDGDRNQWSATAEQADDLGAEKVFGVICAPSCHEPAMFRFVGAKEVEAGVTRLGLCSRCDSHSYRADIIEVLGEPDVARAVYEAEFRSKLEAIA